MSLFGSCELSNDSIEINFENAETELHNIISELKEGEERHLTCKKDFSNSLIKVINTHFSHLPLKAKLLDESSNGILIKVKYPKAGEGCCGCCS